MKRAKCCEGILCRSRPPDIVIRGIASNSCRHFDEYSMGVIAKSKCCQYFDERSIYVNGMFDMLSIFRRLFDNIALA